jgi:hypothetical protein
MGACTEIDGLLEELREAIEEDRHAQRFPYVFRSHRGKKGQKAASQNRALIQEARKRRELESKKHKASKVEAIKEKDHTGLIENL